MTSTLQSVGAGWCVQWFGSVQARLLLASLVLTGCIDRPVGTSQPETSNIFVKQTQTRTVDKIDVLMVVDNSLSMGDKQQVLAAAVPQLLTRLTNPDCVDQTGAGVLPVVRSSPSELCPVGMVPEFAPVNDIHIGVITSSLGSNGGDYCAVEPNDPATLAHDDHAWLVGELDPARTGLATADAFLDWSAEDASDTSRQLPAHTDTFRSLIVAAGELGCGLEMPLEAWLRFLVDPAPPKSVAHADPGVANSFTVRSNLTDPVGGVDTELLRQRAAFLRPDSLLAIVMLSDENDCSLQDHGNAFWPATNTTMIGSSSACSTDPNHSCCYNCSLEKNGPPPPGCEPDPRCAAPNGAALPAEEDASQLRCFDQKRRFGFDFLMPTERYVNALTRGELCWDRDDLHCFAEEEGPALGDAQAAFRTTNPLFVPAEPTPAVTGQLRTGPDLVFLTGIVGVPWQDIATTASLLPGAPLEYQRASEIDWGLLLPTQPGDLADDPLMQESTAPRAGQNPRTLEALAGVDAGRSANAINMHEWNTEGRDLQFACTFDLSQPLSTGQNTGGLPGAARDCEMDCAGDSACAARLSGCDCRDGDRPEERKSPLCQSPEDDSYGTVQYAAKAYPGVRQLTVLRGFFEATRKGSTGDNAVVASICPKNLDWQASASRGYGYNPAVAALVDRLKTKLGGTCLPRPIEADEAGRLPCAVIEAMAPNQADWCDCVAHGRNTVSGELAESVVSHMRQSLFCDVDGRPACATMCLCELPQLDDPSCQNVPGVERNSPRPGYCYVDPAEGLGREEVVADCPLSQKRMLRIVGDAHERQAPAPGSAVFIACAGATHGR